MTRYIKVVDTYAQDDGNCDMSFIVAIAESKADRLVNKLNKIVASDADMKYEEMMDTIKNIGGHVIEPDDEVKW